MWSAYTTGNPVNPVNPVACAGFDPDVQTLWVHATHQPLGSSNIHS
jgi:hypothetical protein